MTGSEKAADLRRLLEEMRGDHADLGDRLASGNGSRFARSELAAKVASIEILTAYLASRIPHREGGGGGTSSGGTPAGIRSPGSEEG